MSETKVVTASFSPQEIAEALCYAAAKRLNVAPGNVLELNTTFNVARQNGGEPELAGALVQITVPAAEPTGAHRSLGAA